MPPRTRFATASATTSGECPVIAPVSPRHRSTYSRPSASVKCAPFAFVTNTGNSPAHFFIQFIGTPPSSESCARLYSSADCGCSATNRFASRSCSFFSLFRSMVVIYACSSFDVILSVPIPIRREGSQPSVQSKPSQRAISVPWMESCLSPQLVNDFLGCVRAGCAGQAVAGMRSRTAKEQSAHRRLVTCPIEYRPHGEELIECQFAVINVPASKAVGRLEILRRNHVRRFHEIGEIRSIGGQRLDHRVHQFSATVLPVPFPQLVRGVLEVRAQHVLAFRRQRRIEQRRNRYVEMRGGGD